MPPPGLRRLTRPGPLDGLNNGSLSGPGLGSLLSGHSLRHMITTQQCGQGPRPGLARGRLPRGHVPRTRPLRPRLPRSQRAEGTGCLCTPDAPAAASTCGVGAIPLVPGQEGCRLGPPRAPHSQRGWAAGAEPVSHLPAGAQCPAGRRWGQDTDEEKQSDDEPGGSARGAGRNRNGQGDPGCRAAAATTVLTGGRQHPHPTAPLGECGTWG